MRSAREELFVGGTAIEPGRREGPPPDLAIEEDVPSAGTRTSTGAREDRLGTSRSSSATILLAEDDAEMRALLAYALRGGGYRVVTCEDGVCLADEIGTAMIPDEKVHFDLILSDIRLPGVTGMEILEAVHDWPGSPPVVLITAFGDEATHTKAEGLGVAAFLDKPFEMDRLLETVRTVLAAEPDPKREAPDRATTAGERRKRGRR